MKSVFARILQKNTRQYFDCVHKEHINAGDGTTTEGLYWFMPIVRKGRPSGSYRPFIYSARPSLDAVKSVKVRDAVSNNVYYVALTDTALETDFSDIANGCCGASNAMPAVVVPDILLEETGCGDPVAGYTYFDVPPPLQAGETYVADGSEENVRFTPSSLAAGGSDTLAAFVTWASANWSAYGTFSQASGKVTLLSATKKTGFIKLTRSKYFESNVPGSVDVSHHYVGNGTINGVALTTLTGTNNAALTTIATAANADAIWSSFGTWSVVGGKLRLVNNGLQSNSPTAVTSFTVTVTVA